LPGATRFARAIVCISVWFPPEFVRGWVGQNRPEQLPSVADKPKKCPLFLIVAEKLLCRVLMKLP
jgi:hypothetical protein